MHPAFSIILFTTASGAGYGLLFWLALFGLAGELPLTWGFGVAAYGLAFILIATGLLASTFHLGHPERAWRAFSQWRSSWLSREGVLALWTFAPGGLAAIGWVFYSDVGGIWSALHVVTAVSAAATVYCTAMIYASLAAIPRWHHPLVAPVYLALAGASGALALQFLSTAFAAASMGLGLATLALIALAAGLKGAYWRQIDTAKAESSTASATGLASWAQVRPLDPPHVQANYLQHEMGFQIARKHSTKLRRIALATLFVLPAMATVAALTLPAPGASGAALLALASAAVGVAIERWLFFAEAEHKVMLYYGKQAV